MTILRGLRRRVHSFTDLRSHQHGSDVHYSESKGPATAQAVEFDPECGAHPSARVTLSCHFNREKLQEAQTATSKHARGHGKHSKGWEGSVEARVPETLQERKQAQATIVVVDFAEDAEPTKVKRSLSARVLRGLVRFSSSSSVSSSRYAPRVVLVNCAHTHILQLRAFLDGMFA